MHTVRKTRQDGQDERVRFTVNRKSLAPSCTLYRTYAVCNDDLTALVHTSHMQTAERAARQCAITTLYHIKCVRPSGPTMLREPRYHRRNWASHVSCRS